MVQRFDGKFVLVIGGNSGIGLASARAFANEGARVLIAGRDADTLRLAGQLIGHDVLACRCDVTQLDQLASLFSYVREVFDRVDVLFVNAGILTIRSIESVTEEDWDRIVDTNVKAAFFCVQRAISQMSSGSAIVMTGSTAGRQGVPGASVYAASKAALRSLARSFAAELVLRGIRVNVVSPGPIETPIFDRAGLAAEEARRVRQREGDSVPMRRMGTPEEVAAAVLFLASDAAAFITGVDLLVAGGAASF